MRLFQKARKIIRLVQLSLKAQNQQVKDQLYHRLKSLKYFLASNLYKLFHMNAGNKVL